MKQDPNVTAPPSFPRFILWEIIGIAGFLHILQFAPANDSTPLFFLANAVVFVAVYPTLYFFSQLNIPVVLKYLISPLGIVLRIILMLSCFVWVTYILYSSGFLLGNVSCYAIF